jgi:hypothetical protein
MRECVELDVNEGKEGKEKRKGRPETDDVMVSLTRIPNCPVQLKWSTASTKPVVVIQPDRPRLGEL